MRHVSVLALNAIMIWTFNCLIKSYIMSASSSSYNIFKLLNIWPTTEAILKKTIRISWHILACCLSMNENQLTSEFRPNAYLLIVDPKLQISHWLANYSPFMSEWWLRSATALNTISPITQIISLFSRCGSIHDCERQLMWRWDRKIYWYFWNAGHQLLEGKPRVQ